MGSSEAMWSNGWSILDTGRHGSFLAFSSHPVSTAASGDNDLNDHDIGQIYYDT